jgi:hypothetical protein
MFIHSAALVTCASLAACGSVTTYQSADVLPRGKWQGMIATSAGGLTDKPQEANTPTATFEIAARVGLGADTDVGLKLYTLGIETSVRHRLSEGRWSWALLGSLGGVITNEDSPTGRAGLTQIRFGAVATKRRSPCLAWNMGPMTTFSILRPAGGGTASGALIGGFFGLDWRFGTKWHLIPEVSLHVTAAGEVPVSGTVGMIGTALSRDF